MESGETSARYTLHTTLAAPADQASPDSLHLLQLRQRGISDPTQVQGSTPTGQVKFQERDNGVLFTFHMTDHLPPNTNNSG